MSAGPGVGVVRPVRGNAADAIVGFLASAGVAHVRDRDQLTEAVDAFVASLGLRARVCELRWGTLLLDAAPEAARMVRLDAQRILDVANRARPGLVSDVRVRVSRNFDRPASREQGRDRDAGGGVQVELGEHVVQGL